MSKPLLSCGHPADHWGYGFCLVDNPQPAALPDGYSEPPEPPVRCGHCGADLSGHPSAASGHICATVLPVDGYSELGERDREAARGYVSAAWATMRNDVLNPDSPFPAPVEQLFDVGRRNVEKAYEALLAAYLRGASPQPKGPA